jgi:hypothetical protein
MALTRLCVLGMVTCLLGLFRDYNMFTPRARGATSYAGACLSSYVDHLRNRLPGDARGWVRWGEWGIKAPNPAQEQSALARMAESAVDLSVTQRALVEQTIRDHCRIRGWLLHAVNVRSNHVHAVVTGRLPGSG